MLKLHKSILAAAVFSVTLSAGISARAADPIAAEEQASKKVANRPEYTEQLKTKYNLTDEQLQQMRSSGAKDNQIAIMAELAKQSNRPVDDIMKMRLEQKLGWGKIAKDLGVHPSAIGDSVSSLRKDVNESKHARKESEHEAREMAKEARHEERDAKKEERRAEKQEREETRHSEREEKREHSNH